MISILHIKTNKHGIYYSEIGIIICFSTQTLQESTKAEIFLCCLKIHPNRDWSELKSEDWIEM